MAMSNPFFDRPILNSPYECPRRHRELDAQGQPTQKIVERLRRAEFITPKLLNTEYQKAFAVSKPTASRDLDELVQLGLFSRAGRTGRGTYYTFNCKGFIKGSSRPVIQRAHKGLTEPGRKQGVVAKTPIKRMGTAKVAVKTPVKSSPISSLKSSLKTPVKSSVKSSVKTDTEILDILSQNSYATIPELAEILELTTRGVEKQIATLKKDGRLRRIGPDKGGHWEVKIVT
jgi:predicted HTH transcriptional regulator